MGNRIQTIENGATTTYTANNMNQYTQAGGTNYTFDADGNLRQESSGASTTVYSYDDENRLITVMKGADTWTYTYDAFGQRVASDKNATTTRFMIDPIGLGNVVGEYDNAGNLMARYNHGLGLLSRSDAVGNPAYYTYDALGNTSEVSDPTGSVLNRYMYAPYGATLYQAGSLPNPFQFVGNLGVTTEMNGLNFMRARYYSSRGGRFLSADPLSLTGGSINLYTYVANIPTISVDPIGLCGKPGSGRDLGKEYDDVFLARNHDPNNLLLRDQEHYLYTASVVQEAGAYGEAWQDVVSAWYMVMTVGYSGAKVSFIGTLLRESGIWKTTIPTWSEVWSGLRGTIDGQLIAGGLSMQSASGFCGWSKDPPKPFGCDQFPWLPWCGSGDGGDSGTSGSGDPNTKTGPTGFGTNGFICAGGVLPYRIDFENETNATAPAQIVQVTDQLSTNLNWSTFQLTDIGFGDQLITIPLGSQYYETIVPMSYDGVEFEVWIIAGIHLASGEVYAEFYSLDPATELPPNVQVGFLPPEDGTGRGMGHVSYTVLAKSGLPTGTQIRNVADVQFDQGEVIATNQRDPHNPGAGIDLGLECLNTIDAAPPTSHVLPLPATTNVTAFLVQWTGQDDTNGSGVQSYDVYVSDNGGAWMQWLTRSTNTSAVFTGQSSHTYGFYSVACDNVGNVEPARGSADALITVIIPFPTLSITRTNNQVIVSWPLWAQGFQLESTARLASRVIWQPVTNMPVVVGDRYAVTLNVSGPGKFYRLNKSAPFPPLNIFWITNKMVISWPQWAEGFQLQSAASLIPPMNWQAVTNAPVLIGDQYTVTLTAVGPSKFFRLALTSISPRLSTGPINNQMAISWPQWAEGFFVESTASLVPPINWQPATNVPVFVSGRYIFTLDVAGPSKFYRLSKP